MKKIGIANSFLTGIGSMNAGYALWEHYAPAGTSFCNISSVLSCDVVNKSVFAEVGGIPVAVIGIAGNILLFVIGLLLMRGTEQKYLPHLYLLLALGALGFSLYLTGIEIFVLGVYCIICLFSQSLVLGVTALATLAWRKNRRIVAPATVG